MIDPGMQERRADEAPPLTGEHPVAHQRPGRDDALSTLQRPGRGFPDEHRDVQGDEEQDQRRSWGGPQLLKLEAGTPPAPMPLDDASQLFTHRVLTATR